MNILEIIERRAGELRDDECWETDHKSATTGYCRVGQRKLHRIAWEAHNAEPIPEGMMVLHTCDNRRCFNPAHLYIGDAGDNARDMHERGRASLGNARVYDHEEFADLRDEQFTLKEIAAITGADFTTVADALKAMAG